MYVHVPVLELMLSDPYYLSGLVLAHITFLIVLLGFAYWRERKNTELKREHNIAIISMIFALIIIYLCSGIVNKFYDSIILTNKTITVKTFCVVPLSVSVNINDISKVLIVTWNNTQYRLTREFGIGSYNYLAGYFNSREFGNVFVLMVRPQGRCWIIIVLKKCKRICALYLSPPKNEYYKLINMLRILGLKIINECR